MGFETAIIMGVGAAAGGGSAALSAQGARSQNQAIAASQASVRRSQKTQARQTARRAGVQQQRVRNEAGRLRGMIRVARAEAGTGIGTTHMALLRQVDIDEAINQQIIRQNFQSQQDSLESQAAANLASLEAQIQNTVLASFAGGLSGLATGLSIASAASSLGLLKGAVAPPAIGPGPPVPYGQSISTPRWPAPAGGTGTFIGGRIG